MTGQFWQVTSKKSNGGTRPCFVDVGLALPSSRSQNFGDGKPSPYIASHNHPNLNSSTAKHTTDSAAPPKI